MLDFSINFQIKTLTDLQRIAAKLGPKLRPGDCVAVSGALGAGKTEFIRMVIQTLLGTETEVPSPTFNLVLTYEWANVTIWHFDLYRLEHPQEALELGIEEALDSGISFIEWPERLGPLLDVERLTVDLDLVAAGPARTLTISGPASWRARWEG